MNTSTNPRVAICISHYSIGYSPSILNLLTYLAERFQLDVYLEEVYLREVPVLELPNVTVYRVPNGQTLGWKFWLRKNLKLYAHHVTIEPKGLLLCKRLFLFPKPIHLSLEIHLKTEDGFPHQSYSLDVLNQETKMAHRLKGLLIQSEERALLYKADHGLGDSLPTFYYPVGYNWDARTTRTRYLRDRLPIPDNHRIALHLGSLEPWYNVDSLVDAFRKIEGWTLVWHGWAEPKAKTAFLERLEKEKISNVHMSPEFFDEIDDMRLILEGADVGIAWYNDISANFRTSGLSSGKISGYLAHGLPTLANRYPATKEAVETPECGFTVSDESEIEEVLHKIMADYQRLSKNAIAEYDHRYNFLKYPAKLDDFLAQL